MSLNSLLQNNTLTHAHTDTHKDTHEHTSQIHTHTAHTQIYTQTH